jgi:hypothetical protein
MGLGVAITSLNTVGQLVGMIPIAGAYCEKMLGAATQLCEVAEVRIVYTDFRYSFYMSTYHISHSVLEAMKKSTSN